MKPNKSDLNRISKYLWKRGHGSKRVLSDASGINHQTEISRMLAGGHISQKKFDAMLKIIYK